MASATRARTAESDAARILMKHNYLDVTVWRVLSEDRASVILFTDERYGERIAKTAYIWPLVKGDEGFDVVEGWPL